MPGTAHKTNAWGSFFSSLRQQGLLAKVLLLVSGLAACALAVSIGFAALNRDRLESVLTDSSAANLQATCQAAQQMIDLDYLDSIDALATTRSSDPQPTNMLNNPEYMHTMAALKQLLSDVRADRIFVVKQIDQAYFIIWDTYSDNGLAFQELSLGSSLLAAMEGETIVEIHALGDKWAGCNSIVCPLVKEGRVIGIISVDISNQAVNDAYNTTKLIIYLLIGSLATMMLALLVAALALYRQSRHNQQQLYEMANTDIVTGLPNRRHLFTYLSDHVENAPPGKAIGSLVALFVDLDNFKSVNDGEGHDTGDELLRLIGDLLNESLDRIAGYGVAKGLGRLEHLTARLGGDEFVQLIASTNQEEAVNYVQRLLESFKRHAGLQEFINKYDINLSIGIALYPEHCDDSNDLIKYADIAMYHAKKHGKGTYAVYSAEMGEAVEGVQLSVRQRTGR